MRIHARPCFLLGLIKSVGQTSGESAKRWVLLSEFGKVIDVVTVVWSSDCKDRVLIEVQQQSLRKDEVLIRVQDQLHKEPWGAWPVGILLHEKTGEAPGDWDSLPWNSTSVLGGVAVEKDRFVLVRPNS